MNKWQSIFNKVSNFPETFSLLNRIQVKEGRKINYIKIYYITKRQRVAFFFFFFYSSLRNIESSNSHMHTHGSLWALFAIMRGHAFQIANYHRCISYCLFITVSLRFNERGFHPSEPHPHLQKQIRKCY